MNQILLLLTTLMLFSSIARTQWHHQPNKDNTIAEDEQTYNLLHSVDLGLLNASTLELEEHSRFNETAICHFTGNPKHVNPHPYPWMGTITADSLIQDSTYYHETKWFRVHRDVDFMYRLSVDEEDICFVRMIRKDEIYL